MVLSNKPNTFKSCCLARKRRQAALEEGQNLT
jgi:hypothetical protein